MGVAVGSGDRGVNVGLDVGMGSRGVNVGLDVEVGLGAVSYTHLTLPTNREV